MATLKVCQGRSCSDHGSKYLIDRAQAELPAHSPVQVETCGCLGECKKAPAVAVETQKKRNIYTNVSGPKLAQIIKKIK